MILLVSVRLHPTNSDAGMTRRESVGRDGRQAAAPAPERLLWRALAKFSPVPCPHSGLYGSDELSVSEQLVQSSSVRGVLDTNG